MAMAMTPHASRFSLEVEGYSLVLAWGKVRLTCIRCYSNVTSFVCASCVQDTLLKAHLIQLHRLLFIHDALVGPIANGDLV